MQRIYLAGFDVFRADSLAHGERLKALCREYGYEGLYPLDNQAPAGLCGPALADWIGLRPRPVNSYSATIFAFCLRDESW